MTWEGSMWHGRGECDVRGGYVMWEGSMWHGRGVCGMGGEYMAWEGSMWHGRGVCDVGEGYRRLIAIPVIMSVLYHQHIGGSRRTIVET